MILDIIDAIEKDLQPTGASSTGVPLWRYGGGEGDGWEYRCGVPAFTSSLGERSIGIHNE